MYDIKIGIKYSIDNFSRCKAVITVELSDVLAAQIRLSGYTCTGRAGEISKTLSGSDWVEVEDKQVNEELRKIDDACRKIAAHHRNLVSVQPKDREIEKSF